MVRSGHAFEARFFIHMQDSTTPTLIERLFKAGAHFGFSKSRRHPSVTPYLFGSKQGFDIFDLEKTGALLEDAAAHLTQLGLDGKRLMVVGTKEEVASLVRSAAETAQVPWVTGRWIGGTLSNFSQIRKRVEHLLTLRAQKESGELDRKYTKKERLMLDRDMERLAQNFEGIIGLEQLPHTLVVVDPRHDAIAVREARELGIPVVGIMNSDCNVREVTKPVIMNDAHRNSIMLALSHLLAAYDSGRAAFVPKQSVPPTQKVSRAA